MSTVRIINLSFQIWGSVMSLITILCLIFCKRTKLKSDRQFLNLVALNMFSMLMDAIALYYRGRLTPTSFFFVRATNFLQFFFNIMLSVTFLYYEYCHIEERTNIKLPRTYLYCNFVSADVSILLLAINLFFPFMYQIDAVNLYSRMPFYPLIYLTSFTTLLLSIIIIWNYRDHLSSSEKIIFLIYIFIPLISLSLSVFIYGIVFGYLGTTASIIIMFVFLQSQVGKHIAEQEVIITKGQINTMLSQIQPHFLYNMLASISELCKEDANLASLAAENFSIYMRSNMDSLSRQTLISLESELEHVKNYVWLEKLRFGDDLVINFDILCKNISLPAMTLQPLVENSILHGYMGSTGIVHITISSREFDDHYEIRVTDDGCGFDIHEEKHDNRSHVGMENVKKRLAYMAQGTMQVESAIGHGTTITITLPKDS